MKIIKTLSFAVLFFLIGGIANMVYERVGWEDYPSTNTPRDAEHLNVMDKGIDDSKNEINSLQSQLDALVVEGDSSVEAAQARVNADGSVTYDTLKDRLDAEHQTVETQLEASAKQSDVKYEVSLSNETLGVTNESDLLAKTDFFETDLSNKLRLEISSEFIYDSAFPNEISKKIIKGNKNIKSKSSSSLYEKKIETSDLYYIGDINSGNSVMSKFFDRLRTSLETKIVIVGDSISMGSDFSSNREMPGVAMGDGPNTDTAINTWTYHFAKEIMSAFPTANITVYNRSIGGMSYQHFNQVVNTFAPNHTLSGRENFDGTKTWYENVKACNPTLVIFAMGMNHMGNHYAQFKANFYDLAIADGFINTCDFAVLTTPNPAYVNTDKGDFREYTYNGYKLALQVQQKNIAMANGWYCIDVGRLSTLYRYGIDFDSMVVDVADAPNVSFTKSASQTAVPQDTFVDVTANDTSLVLNLDDRNFFGQHSWKIYFSSEFWAGGASNYMYYYITPQVSLKIIGDGRVILATPSGSKTISGFNPASANFRLDILPHSLQLWIDGVPKLQTSNPIYDSINATEFAWALVGSGWTNTIALTGVKYPKFTVYNKVVSHGDIFNADALSANWTDGGVNHPTALGVMHIYFPAINEFVDDIKVAYEHYIRYVIRPLTGTAAPTFSPQYPGQEYIDTTNKIVYKATGYTVSSWVALN